MQWQVDLLQLSLCLSLSLSLSLHISLPSSRSSSRWSIRLGASWRLLQFQVAQLENSFDALLRDEAGRCHNQIAAKATIANCWVANVLCNHVCLAVCVRVCVWHCDVATKSHRKKLPPVLCLSSFSYSFRLWFSASVFGFSFLAFFGFAFSCCSCQLVQPSFSASALALAEQTSLRLSSGRQICMENSIK